MKNYKFSVMPVCLVCLASWFPAMNASAMPVAEAGQPIVTGEPSRVGPPWNHRTTIHLPGTQTDIAFGGFVKFDMMYDFDYDLTSVTNPVELVGEKSQADKTKGRTSFSAATSRLNFRSQTATDYGKLSTYVEGQFYPSGFSLRHAYGEFNGFLLGQTWSNFESFVAGLDLDILKLGDPVGYAFQRHPQVRYTMQNGNHLLAVALEEPQTIIASDPEDNDVEQESQLPDLSVRYEYKRNFAASAILRRLETNGEYGDIDDKTMGYGIQLQASLPLTASTTLKSNLLYGSGLGNYTGAPNNVDTRLPDVYIDDNHIKAIDLAGYSASLIHTWTPGWSSTLSYTYVDQDLPKNDYPYFANHFGYAFTNLVWDVTDQLKMGVEYQYVDHMTLNNGITRNASRLQYTTYFQF